MTGNRLIYLALSWIVFCVLHSLLIALPVTDWLRRFKPGYERYERLIYNIIALMTLIPPLYLGWTINSDPIFAWSGGLRWVQALLVLWALLLFWGGARQFDTARLLRENGGGYRTAENDPLVTDGILNIVRHPWYSGGIVIIWARDINAAAMVTNFILALYFIVGAFLEERRLVRQYGSVYQHYQSKVDMFFPWRWFMRRLISS